MGIVYSANENPNITGDTYKVDNDGYIVVCKDKDIPRDSSADLIIIKENTLTTGKVSVTLNEFTTESLSPYIKSLDISAAIIALHEDGEIIEDIMQVV